MILVSSGTGFPSNSPSLEIILNGGIETLDDGLNNLQDLDGIMMGRSSYSDPFQLSKVDSLFFDKEDMYKIEKMEIG